MRKYDLKKIYNEQKASQLIAAFLLESGEAMTVLKIIKLIYLSDRENIKEYGYPILDEERYCLPQGPVNSFTYDLIKETIIKKQNNQFVLKQGKETGLDKCRLIARSTGLSRDDLDELSDDDIAIVKHIWRSFGSKTGGDLSEYTHEHFQEWEDPSELKPQRTYLPFKRIAYALNTKTAKQKIQDYEAYLERSDFLNKMREL